MIEQLDKTNFQVRMPSGDTVEIGDKRYHDTFEPHIKLNRWGEECFIRVGLQTTEKHKPTIEGDKVKWQGNKLDAHFYALEPRTVTAKDKDGRDASFKQYELGGFDFEIILKEKPANNKIILNIETQGLVFYYQPPLTAKEIAGGHVRPDNVVGSYVACHATRTNMHRNKADAEKYKAGIAGLFYCPKITDAIGKWVWGQLVLDEQAHTLSVIIDQNFLDTAIYPVSTGSTNFGYEIGGSSSGNGNDYIFGIPATTGDPGGTVESISWYSTTDGTSNEWRGTLHLVSDKSRIDYTAAHVHTSNPGWETEDCTQSGSVLASTAYYIGGWCKPSTRLHWNTGLTGFYDAMTYHATNPPDDPLDPSDYANHQISVYCTYGVAAGIPVQSFMHMQRLRRQG